MASPSFSDVHAGSLEKALQNAEIVAVVRSFVTLDEICRDLTEAPFVCVIDSPAMGTSRAVSSYVTTVFVRSCAQTSASLS